MEKDLFFSYKIITFANMDKLHDYRSQICTRNLMCNAYSEKWDACTSRKQFFDMAVSEQGSATLCRSLAEGWGIDADYISTKFKSYINGKYISLQKGYDSKMYCLLDGEMYADCTNNIIVNCKGDVLIRKNNVCEIRVVNSDLHIEAVGFGYCTVIKYGECNLTFGDTVKYHIKNGI